MLIVLSLQQFICLKYGQIYHFKHFQIGTDKFINAYFSSSGILENILHEYGLNYYQFPSQIVNNPMKKTTQKCQTCFYLYIWRQVIQDCISVRCKLVLDVI